MCSWSFVSLQAPEVAEGQPFMDDSILKRQPRRLGLGGVLRFLGVPESKGLGS